MAILTNVIFLSLWAQLASSIPTTTEISKREICGDLSPLCFPLICNSKIIHWICKRTCKMCSAGKFRLLPYSNGWDLELPRQCGTFSVPYLLVVGGRDAKRGSWPWQAAIFHKQNFVCGGSLVSSQWVITAAHCFINKRADHEYTIYLGVHDLRMRARSSQIVGVEKIILDPKWLEKIQDIAFIKLKRPARINNRVNAVCLPGKDEMVPVGTRCYITGWGKTTSQGAFSSILQQVDLPIASKSVCQSWNKNISRPRVTDDMFCAGPDKTINKGACFGDSGGPLVCPVGINHVFKLYGVISWGSKTCDSRKGLTVFTKITALRSLIKKQTGL